MSGVYMWLVLMIASLCTVASVFSVAALEDGVNTSEPLISDQGIFLRVGETWNFYQGYSMTLRDVSDDGVYAWVQLSRGNVVVKDTIVTTGSTLMFNKSIDGKRITIFRIVVEGVYANPSGYLVTFSPVIQYFDPTLPMSTPASANNTSTLPVTPLPPTPSSTPSYVLVFSAIIVILLTFYMMRRI
jgi:hypothetical protein